MLAILRLLAILPRVEGRFLRSEISSKLHPQKIAVDIFRLYFALGISLDSQRLPTKTMLVAIYSAGLSTGMTGA